MQARDGGVEVLHQLRLGDLEDQAAGRDPGGPGALEDVLGQPGREQLGAGEVDADDHVRRVQPHAQPRQVGARARQQLAAERHDHAAPLGERDEDVGGDAAALAVRPARERLHAAQPAVAHVHHRLVVQLDLVAVDRAPQVGGEREALDGAGQHRRLERAVARLAASLRRAHREVGRAHELVGVGQVAARDGDADARAQLEPAPAEVERAREREQDPLGDARRAVRLGEVLDQHGELVAAEPRDGVGGAQHAPQAPAHLEQHLVAAAVAEGVVERLEVVEVDEQDGDRRVVAALERVPDAVEQQRAVGHPGERVVERAVAQLVVAGAQRVGHLVQLVERLAQRGREQQGGEEYGEDRPLLVGGRDRGAGELQREHEQQPR